MELHRCAWPPRTPARSSRSLPTPTDPRSTGRRGEARAPCQRPRAGPLADGRGYRIPDGTQRRSQVSSSNAPVIRSSVSSASATRSSNGAARASGRPIGAAALQANTGGPVGYDEQQRRGRRLAGGRQRRGHRVADQRADARSGVCQRQVVARVVAGAVIPAQRVRGARRSRRLRGSAGRLERIGEFLLVSGRAAVELRRERRAQAASDRRAFRHAGGEQVAPVDR